MEGPVACKTSKQLSANNQQSGIEDNDEGCTNRQMGANFYRNDPIESSTIEKTVSDSLVYDVEHLATFSTNSTRRSSRNKPKSGRKSDSASTIASKSEQNSHDGSSSSSELDNYVDADGNDCDASRQANECCACAKNDGHDNDHECEFKARGSSKLATTTTNGNKLNYRQTKHQQHNSNATKPRVALEQLFELEKLSGIWTQRMQIELRPRHMLILDCETNAVVEKFSQTSVKCPVAFNQYNDIYNNIVVFKIYQNKQDENEEEGEAAQDELDRSKSTTRAESSGQESNSSKANEESDQQVTSNSNGELHIFQCISHRAQQLVDDICAWKAGHLFAGADHPKPRAPLNESGAEPRADKGKNSLKLTACDAAGGQSEAKVDLLAGGDDDDDESGKQLETTSQVLGKGLMMNEEANQVGQIDKTKRPGTAKQAGQPKPPANASINGSGNKSNQQQQQQNGNNTKQTTNNDQAASRQNSAPIVTVQASSSSSEHNSNNNKVPMVNVNVKETVQVFNQIAALREKGSKPNSPTGPPNASNNNHRPLSDSSMASSTNGVAPGGPASSSSGHQLYKQRSIRVTLAPNSDQQQQQASDKPFGSSQQANNNKRSPEASIMADQRPPVASSSGPDSTSSGSSATNHQGATSGSGSHQQLAGASSKHHQIQTQQAAGKSLKPTSSRPPSGGANNGAKLAHNGNQNSTTTATSGQHANGSTSSSSTSMGRIQNGSPPTQLNQQHQLDQVTTNESYVSVLNHCFDDIEKFIIRLQQAASASRELQAKRKLSRRSNQVALNNNGPINGKDGNLLLADSQSQLPITASELAILSSRARGPSEDDYFEILSKFKLAFNLLAKLKGCIHEPNAPELVHFLFTPLVIIIESARNVVPPIDPTLVGIPYLNKDALELLSNCCTSKESDMWHSLGLNWTQTIDPNLLKASRLPSSFQPIFSDGWAPIITELDLIGLGLGVGVSLQPTKVGGASKQPAASAALATDSLGADHYRDRRSYLHPTNDELPPLPLQQQLMSNEHGQDGGIYAPGRSRHAARRTHRTGSPPSNGAGPAGGLLANGSRSRSYGFGLDAKGAPLPQPPVEMMGPGGRAKSGSRRLPLQASQDQAGYPMIHHYQQQHAFNDDLADDYRAPPLHAGTYLSNGAVSSDYYAELHDQYQDYSQYRRSRLTSASHHHGSGYLAPTDLRQPRGSSKRYQRNAAALHYHSGLNLGNDSIQPYIHHDNGLNFNEAEREAMLLDLGPAQTDWFLDLQARGSLIVRVLFGREANNDKELSVRRGEILEIIDDTRKWWKARNIDLQVAYVPHTIVAVIEQYQTLDELLTNSPVDGGGSGSGGASDLVADLRHPKNDPNNFHQRLPTTTNQLVKNVDYEQNYGRKDKRNAKTAGAFRYF